MFAGPVGGVIMARRSEIIKTEFSILGSIKKADRVRIASTVGGLFTAARLFLFDVRRCEANIFSEIKIKD